MSQATLLKRLLLDQSGASAIEYGLILGMISIALIVAMQGLALGVNAVWDSATTNANTALTGSSG